MFFKSFLLFFLLYFSNTLESIAQLPYASFGVEKGLSQASNYFMLKDSKGYLWISSKDGLNRFDGRNFTTYYYSPLDSNSLYGSLVNNFIEDDNGSLFIGTSKGLCYYNSYTNSFSRINIFANERVSEIDVYILYKNEDTLLIFDDTNGLYQINAKTRTLINLDTTIRVPAQYFGYSSMRFFAEKKIVLFATKEGLVKYDMNRKKTFFLSFREQLFSKSLTQRIFSVSKIDANTAGLGTNDGFFYLSIDSFLLGRHFVMPNSKRSEVYALYKDTSENTWIGSNDTIIYKLENNKIASTNLSFNSTTENSVKDVSSFYFTQENIFINEDTKGLGVIKRNRNFVTKYTAKNNSFFANGDPSTYCFAEQESGKVWIGKSTDGIFIYNTVNKSFTDFNSFSDKQLASNKIKSLLFNKNKLYIGTQNGVFMYDLKAKKILQLEFPKEFNGVESKNCNHIIKLKDERILVGTRDGIFLIGDSINYLRSVSSSRQFCYYLLENSKGQILTTGINSNLEVYKFDKSNFELVGSYLQQFSILGIWQNIKKDEYWFACREGIVHTDSKYQILHYFNSSTGLKSNCFYGIIPDGFNNIWCTSNKGIVTIDLDTNTPYYFFSENELSGIEYNGKAIFRSAEGKIYFGSETGFDEFDPNIALKQTKSIYTIQFEKFLVNEKPLTAKQSIQIEYGILKLNYNENNVSIKINAVNCDNSFAPKLMYKIEGFQDDWIEVNSNEWIRLIHLKPGVYKIQCKLKDRQNYDRDNVFVIKVKPAFYQTTVFKIAVVVLFLLFLYCLYRFRISQLMKMQNLRQKISSNLHDDIGSTLSSINIYTQVAKLKPDYLNYIDLIQKNTQEVLDKLDDIVWATNPKNDKVENLIDRMENFASPLLEAIQINFLFEYDKGLENLRISETTRQGLFLIFKEAINNVAKYAKCKKCKVVLSVKAKRINCIIQDDGIGFNDLQTTERNGLLNMLITAKELKGKLDIITKITEGTIIKVSLPI